MMNRFSFASLVLACLLLAVSIDTNDAIAQKRTTSKAQNSISSETSKPKPAKSIDVLGLQSIGDPQASSNLNDTVVSRDGRMKVVNTPTGAYFIMNQPNAAQQDTLNDWHRSARSERASEIKRR
jgi:hypothetical protein